jgi:hemoglobin-like flavoprotein
MANSKRFLMHSTFLVGMIEKALNMLGVANDELTAMMSDLGRKHVVYGVKADYFPHMKSAIIAMLHEMLEMKFSTEDEDAWDEVLSVLTTDMTKAQREVNMKKEVGKHNKRRN